MKRLLFASALIAALGASGIARARVFETYDECVARYGKPVTTTKTDIGSNVSFLKNEISVQVEFRKDKAVSVTYSKQQNTQKPEENRDFGDEEINRLLESNSGPEHKWKPVKKDMHGQPYWVTEDNVLNARLTNGRYLKVEDTQEFIRRGKDLPPAVKPAKRDLDGF